jgi:hypothetical protein
MHSFALIKQFPVAFLAIVAAPVVAFSLFASLLCLMCHYMTTIYPKEWIFDFERLLFGRQRSTTAAEIRERPGICREIPIGAVIAAKTMDYHSD